MTRPSNKILAFAFTTLIILGSIFFSQYRKNFPKIEPPILVKSADNRYLEAAERDSDGDSLKDWEEALWKTDPTNPDTDKDGTPDGAEIAAKRDPLKAGPKDQIVEKTAENKIAQNEGENLTTTDRLSRLLLARYLQAKNAGETINVAAESDALTDYFTKNTVPESAKQYTLADFQTFSGENPTAIRDFGNTLAGIFFSNTPKNYENEAVILQRAIETDSEAELKKLDPIIKSYNGIIAGLLKIPVPESAVNTIKNLANNLSELKSYVERMRAAFNDPVSIVPYIELYETAVQSVSADWVALVDYFNRKGIVFNRNENGSTFNVEI